MIIRRATELRANMGNFEHVILRAEVELDTTEAGFESTPEQALEAAQELLDKALQADSIEARECTALGEGESFIHNWKA